MLKYYMTIDGAEYKALFLDHIEAADFIDDNIRDGSEVVVYKYHEITAEEVLKDNDFEHYYSIEMASKILIPNYKDFKKVWDLEDELILLGYLPKPRYWNYEEEHNMMPMPTVKEEKRITVSRLKQILEFVEGEGYGDFELMYLDFNEMAWNVTEGVHDVFEKDKIVVLG